MIKSIKNKYKKKKSELFPSTYHKIRLHYAENYDSTEVDDYLIFYETRDGKSIVDSPYAMFLELANNPKYASYKHVWSINDNVENIRESIPDYLRDKVVFVERDSIPYVDAILTAKYIISNSTMDNFFTKKSNQVYINTWHGTPLKFMGFDTPGNLSNSQNVLRNFLMTDYLFSPNSHTTDIFVNSYKLKDVYPGKIIEGGYPRIDLTFNTSKEEIQEKLIRQGIIYKTNQPLLLFSPTWKGSSVNNAEDDIDQIIKETLILVERFSEIYNVLVKVHPFIYSKVSQDDRIKDYLISDLTDANELLSITDVLVTDYSSIFFDFLVTGKPIIFYSWDKDLYEASRGMYLDTDVLPGPTAENIYELIELIDLVDEGKDTYQSKYNELASKMVNYDDGHTTERYIDYIFNQKESDKLTIHDVNSQKTKLLFYPGGMRNNGITTSFLNLINNINYEKYDVTIITNSTTNREINGNLNKINPKARVMFRFGAHILSKKERELNNYLMQNGVSKDKRDEFPEKAYKREMNRLTSNLIFDVAIDFSGYSFFWGRHVLSANADKYIAFMHSDLKSDSMREINGKTPMKNDLEGIFSIYYKFDRLLSVSPMTRDVNYSNLKDYVSEKQMSYVYNSINIDQILNSKEKIEKIVPDKIVLSKKLLIVNESINGKIYKNIKAINKQDFTFTELEKGQKVVQHATYQLEEVWYSKVSIDGVYAGWLLSEYFANRLLEIEEIKDFHAYGTVSKNYHFPIWNQVRTNSDSDQIISYARHFKLKYLEITKEAKTENGRYYFVSYNGNEIGWISTSPIMRIHKVDALGLIDRHFRKKMSLMEAESPTNYSSHVENWLELYAKLRKNVEIKLWSEPSPVVDAKELPISEEYYSLAFKVTQQMTFSDGIYSRLTLEDGSFIGYVNQEMLEMITEEEFISLSSIEEEYGLSILPKVDLSMQKVPEFRSDYFNLVNMGRLSVEKNQINLITAFKKFNEEVPNSRLYFLGKGPLQAELIEHIKELELDGKVILLGHISNPFEFMRLNDYFVLPSHYEGQPMVLLESLTIGLNILASNIPANINIIGADEKYGLLTDGTEVDDIYNGIKKAYSFDGEFEPFDYEAYNREAINSFYNELLK